MNEYLKLRNITWFLVGILLVTATSALAMAETQKSPFLYKVEKDGKASYVLGSMHAGIPLDTFPSEIYEKFDQAKVVAFEGDREAIRTQYGDSLRKSALYPAGQSLDQELDATQMQKLEQVLGNEFDRSTLVQYKPWAINDQIGSTAEARLKKTSGTSWSFDEGIDSSLLKRVQKMNRAVQFLDRPDSMMKDYGQQFLANDLKRLLAYPDPIQHEVDCANRAKGSYLSGDEKGLQDYIARGCETPKSVASMNQRSLDWIPHLKILLRDGDAFVVFGAGHLHGPAGVLTSLEKEGYQITRVPAKDAPGSAQAPLSTKPAALIR